MNPRYIVRLARPADLPAILAIERSGFGEWAWDRNLFAEYTRRCGEHFLVVLAGSKVMGYCIGCVVRGAGSVESIAVAPAVRGKGAADALLRALFQRFRLRKIPRVALTVKLTNLRAIAFYGKYGFRRIRRLPQYYEDHEDGILFHLDL